MSLRVVPATVTGLRAYNPQGSDFALVTRLRRLQFSGEAPVWALALAHDCYLGVAACHEDVVYLHVSGPYRRRGTGYVLWRWLRLDGRPELRALVSGIGAEAFAERLGYRVTDRKGHLWTFGFGVSSPLRGGEVTG